MVKSTYLCKMKAVIITLVALCSCVTATAQFNTIFNSSHHYQVKVTHADSGEVSANNDSTPTGTKVADDVHKSVSTKGKTVGNEVWNVDSIRQSLIERYLSVAYPLAHIHISSPYGMRVHPIMRKRMMHGGIDLRAKYEEVYSVMEGDVTKVSSDRRSGKYVVVEYPGRFSCAYCHLSQPLVKTGDHVRAGEVIGISGNTGMSTGAHLHFGVRRAGGQRIDPMILLEFVRQTREDVVRELRELNELAS